MVSILQGVGMYYHIQRPCRKYARYSTLSTISTRGYNHNVCSSSSQYTTSTLSRIPKMPNRVNHTTTTTTATTISYYYRSIVLRCMSSMSSSSSSSDINTQLRNMIKPFLLKCHPDVHVATTSKQINMIAIQNLNSYLDTIHSISNGTYKHQNSTSSSDDSSSERITEIDFVILVDNDRIKRKTKDGGSEQLASRRKVELTLPPIQLSINLVNYTNRIIPSNSEESRIIQRLQNRLVQHTRQELVKLLRIAGLSNEVIQESSRDIHEMIVDDILGGSDYDYYTTADPTYTSTTTTEASGSTTTTNAFRRAHHMRPTTKSRRTRPKSFYEISRDQYTANIPWHNYQKLYDDAVAEMNADYYTSGLIAKHPGRRRAMIARILSNIRIQKLSSHSEEDSDDTTEQQNPNNNINNNISFVEQLVAFRRLTILLDSHFDQLQMEEFGHMWESSRIVLTEPRPYNTSRSALFKRKAAAVAGTTTTTTTFHDDINDDTMTSSSSNSNTFAVSGYSFTLHPNLSVTITIPIDFRDDELIDELDSNVWDFYNYIGDGTEDFFEQQHHSSA